MMPSVEPGMPPRTLLAARSAVPAMLRSSRVSPVEREGLDPDSPWWAEHRSRYRFAAGFLPAERVLDIACGSGLGMDLLSRGGTQVVGIDISEEALRTALSREGSVTVCRADATKLPLQTASFDLIASFETIEHVDADVGFISELRRVIRDDGVLLLSTPNALHTKPVAGVPKNPFHVREYEPAEFKELVSDHFGTVELLAHRVDPLFGPCPYWDVRTEARTSGLRTVTWKILARFPRRFREWAHQALFGVAFYPGEQDFAFVPEGIESGHVLVAVCRP